MINNLIVFHKGFNPFQYYFFILVCHIIAYIFKLVCCRLVVCGNGLMMTPGIHSLGFIIFKHGPFTVKSCRFVSNKYFYDKYYPLAPSISCPHQRNIMTPRTLKRHFYAVSLTYKKLLHIIDMDLETCIAD